MEHDGCAGNQLLILDLADAESSDQQIVAGLDRERDAVQHRRVLGVRERDVLEHDLAAAALNAAADPTCARNRVLDLVGPESLPMSEIVRRGARIRGTRPRIVPVPASALKTILRLTRRFVPVGLSPDVIDVMQTDVRHNPKPAAEALGIRLTPLDDTIRRSLEIAGAS